MKLVPLADRVLLKPVEAMERFLFFLNKYPGNAQMLLDLKQKA